MKLMTLTALTLGAFLYSPATHAAKPPAMTAQACREALPLETITQAIKQGTLNRFQGRFQGATGGHWALTKPIANFDWWTIYDCITAFCQSNAVYNPQTHECSSTITTPEGKSTTLHFKPAP